VTLGRAGLGGNASTRWYRWTTAARGQHRHALRTSSRSS